MKIARIVLTATILLSLKSTLFCSAAQESQETEIIISASRRKSHDGTRDGRFGSAADTFAKLGQPYKGAFGLGEEQVYDLGSDEQAPARWASFGKTIKTLADAQKWVTAIKRKGWTLPEESMKPAQDIIAADRALNIKNNCETFHVMQEESRSLLAKIVTTEEKRKQLDYDRNQFYAQQIKQITDKKAREFADRNSLRFQEDEKAIVDLKNSLEKTKNFRLGHNQQFPENPIVGKPVIKREDIDKLNAKTLATIAAKYNAALKDAAV